MTLHELQLAIERVLFECPKAADFTVYTEGCDCYGDTDKLEVDEDRASVVVTRSWR